MTYIYLLIRISAKVLNKGFYMKQKLILIIKKREYDIWKSESLKGTNKYEEALKVLDFYNKELISFTKTYL